MPSQLLRLLSAIAIAIAIGIGIMHRSSPSPTHHFSRGTIGTYARLGKGPATKKTTQLMRLPSPLWGLVGRTRFSLQENRWGGAGVLPLGW